MNSVHYQLLSKKSRVRVRDPFIHTLRNLTKTLNWKPYYIYKQPGADPGRLCAVLPHSLWSHWFRGPCFLSIPHPLWHLHSSCLSFCRVPEPWGFAGDSLFKAECSKVSHSLHDAWLWVSYLFPYATEGASCLQWVVSSAMVLYPLLVDLSPFHKRKFTNREKKKCEHIAPTRSQRGQAFRMWETKPAASKEPYCWAAVQIF